MRLLPWTLAVALAACAEPDSSETSSSSARCERLRDDAVDRALADVDDLPADVIDVHRAQLRAALTDHYARLCAEGDR